MSQRKEIWFRIKKTLQAGFYLGEKNQEKKSGQGLTGVPLRTNQNKPVATTQGQRNNNALKQEEITSCVVLVNKNRHFCIVFILLTTISLVFINPKYNNTSYIQLQLRHMTSI